MNEIAVFLPDSDTLTGAPRRVLTLCRELDRLGIKFFALAAKEGVMAQEARRQGLNTVVIERGRILSQRHGLLFRPDWVLLAGLSLIGYNLRLFWKLRSLKIKCVWIRSAKGIAFYGFASRLSGGKIIWDIDYELPSKGIVRGLHKMGLSLSSCVVTQFESAPVKIFGEHLAYQYSKSFVPLIPGIDLKGLKTLQEYRSHRSNTNESFTILHVGTICRRKGQLTTVQSASRLSRLAPELSFRVLFAGGTYELDYDQEVKNTCAEYGLTEHISFLGWRDDVTELMADADVVVLPSLDEGVPNTLQEAMYIGVPVITSPVGGVEEILEDGVTGWVISKDDVQSWAEKMVHIATNPIQAQKVANRAKEFAKKNFNACSWAKRYAEIIRSHCLGL